MPKTALERARQMQLRKIMYVKAHKAERGCEICGEMDLVVLELHHKEPAIKVPYTYNKRRGVTGTNWRNLPWGTIETELAKCQVLCANCHKRVTYARKANS